MNDRIRSPQVRLVGADGDADRGGHTQDALRQARDLDLDLVEVAPQADPPVCRIMDYGKYKYERDIRQKEARKKQSRVERQGDQVPPQDRPARLRHEEGPRRAVPERAGQGQGHDHVPRARDGAHGARSQDPGPAGRRPRGRIVVDVLAQAGRPQHDHGDRAQQAATSRHRPRRPRSWPRSRKWPTARPTPPNPKQRTPSPMLPPRPSRNAPVEPEPEPQPVTVESPASDNEG